MNTSALSLTLTLALALAALGASAAPSVASLSVTPTLGASTASTANMALPQPASTDAQAAADLRLEALGMGDLVRVTVFRNPELTTEARVSERGTILFPMLGEVPISGLTPSQAGQRIADRLRAGKYVVNPEVNVSLAQVNSRQVSVLGAVAKPGRYPLDSTNVRLSDFLAVAGGIAAGGSDEVTILTNRSGKQEKIEVDLGKMLRNGDFSKNVALEPGDTIFVQKAPMVYIYGEVQKAGAYPLTPHMTVMQALAMGGGVTVRGTERGIKISRREDNGNTRRIDASLNDSVQPDDVIYVRESLF
ncbi:MAG: polysaccharide export protein EpsE [Usitatibacter sp.]